MNLDEIMAKLELLPPSEVAKLKKEVSTRMENVKWVPNPGPQTDAYFCKADLLFYGGQAAGGKSDLLAGLALTSHKNSLIMRRQGTELGALIDRVLSINGSRDGFNGSPPPSLKTDGRFIEFGAANKLGDEESWMGQAHDLLGFDEAVQFLEHQVRFLMGWVRPRDEKDVGIRCRTVLASNPPMSSEGDWIIGMFRPWLDAMHPNPAKHGELRWFLTDPDGKDVEAEGPDDKRIWNGDEYTPMSRTFIPAKLSDNPTLVRTNYKVTLDSMPEPMRSALRDGNFMAAREDSEWQVIPTSWVLAANERWREQKPDGEMSAIGIDVARGGRDETVLTPRYGKFFCEQISVPGRETPDGSHVVALAALHLRDGAPVNIDSIGIGADAETAFKNAGVIVNPLNGAAGSSCATRDGSFQFKNKRSEMYWMLREALNPEYGENIALPPSQKLQTDLTAPHFSIKPGEPPKIYVESKLDIQARLGRSPDYGDSVVYAWAGGELEGSSRERGHSPEPVTEYDILGF